MSIVMKPEHTAARLATLFWLEFELSRLAAGWVPGVAQYENKQRLGRFMYLHNRNAHFIHERLRELPISLHEKEGPPTIIAEAMERMSLAANEQGFYVAYLYVIEQMEKEYNQLYHELDPLLDLPSLDQLDLIMPALPQMQGWLREQIRFAHSEDQEQQELLRQWGEYIALVWYQMKEGLANGRESVKMAWPKSPIESAAGPVPNDSAWDEVNFPLYTFPKNPMKSYSDPLMSPLYDSVKQMHYINATEISAAEALCYLYYGVRGMSMQFYYDLARHTWDEFRHSEMGVRRLRQMGLETKDFKFFKGSPGKEVTQQWFADMYASLTMVAEPCSFIKKKKSTAAFQSFGDALSSAHCEYDMVDERMHVDFGKKWGPELYKKLNDVVTAEQLSERARNRRLNELQAGDEEEVKKIAKNFPAFCGFSTSDLKYETY